MLVKFPHAGQAYETRGSSPLNIFLALACASGIGARSLGPALSRSPPLSARSGSPATWPLLRRALVGCHGSHGRIFAKIPAVEGLDELITDRAEGFALVYGSSDFRTCLRVAFHGILEGFMKQNRAQSERKRPKREGFYCDAVRVECDIWWIYPFSNANCES